MNGILRHFQELDWPIVVCLLLLAAISLTSIFSSSFFLGDFSKFKRQVVFLILGFSLMFLISFFDWRVLRDSRLTLLLYFLLVFALLGLVLFGKETRGIKGWYRLGPVSFDPVPFAEIVLILILAKYFSLRHVELYNPKHIFISGLYSLLPFILVFFQPDFGSAAFFLFVWIGILVASGIEIKHFFALFFFLLLFAFLSWVFLLKPYQKERITGFILPQTDLRTINWSQTQSKIAIGNGGPFGKGFKRGTQVQFGFLTFPKTDFILAAIGEEFGFVGISVVLLLIFSVCFRVIRIACWSKSNFLRLFAFGLSTAIMSQAFVHASVNLGALPVIGLPLPFVSYGGSQILANFIGLGIFQSIKTHPEQ